MGCMGSGRDQRKLQSTEDQNYKRGILFPIFYFEKKEREISPSTALSEFPQRAQPTQYNTTSKISSPHSAVVIKGDTGNSYPLPNLQQACLVCPEAGDKERKKLKFIKKVEAKNIIN